jgi:hypothetical protein
MGLPTHFYSSELQDLFFSSKFGIVGLIIRNYGGFPIGEGREEWRIVIPMPALRHSTPLSASGKNVKLKTERLSKSMILKMIFNGL